jgi:hypothetical protein
MKVVMSIEFVVDRCGSSLKTLRMNIMLSLSHSESVITNDLGEVTTILTTKLSSLEEDGRNT